MVLVGRAIPGRNARQPRQGIVVPVLAVLLVPVVAGVNHVVGDCGGVLVREMLVRQPVRDRKRGSREAHEQGGQEREEAGGGGSAHIGIYPIRRAGARTTYPVKRTRGVGPVKATCTAQTPAVNHLIAVLTAVPRVQGRAGSGRAHTRDTASAAASCFRLHGKTI